MPTSRESCRHTQAQMHKRQPASIQPLVVLSLGPAAEQASNQLADLVSNYVCVYRQRCIFEIVKSPDGAIECAASMLFQCPQVDDRLRRKNLRRLKAGWGATTQSSSSLSPFQTTGGD
jgi:hypothetical protein